jgi:hypothetical protein
MVPVPVTQTPELQMFSPKILHRTGQEKHFAKMLDEN